MSWTYHEVIPPSQWRGGYIGSGETKRPFYFSCGDCGAKDAVIAGTLARGPRFEDVGVLPGEHGFMRLALFCDPCFKARIEKAKAGVKEEPAVKQEEMAC